MVKTSTKKEVEFMGLYNSKILILAFISLILLLNSTSIVRASFKIKTSCDSGYCLSGEEVYVNISVTNEGTKVMNLKRIILMDNNDKEFTGTAGDKINGGEQREFSLKFTPKPKRSTIFSFKPCFVILLNHSGNISEDMACYDYKNVTVMPNPIKHCKTNLDCEDNRYCFNGLCFNLTCTGCSHPSNHTCEAYECCGDNMCKAYEYCSNHTCTFLECKENETFGNHSCERLKCGRFKEAKNHKCAYKEQFIKSIKITTVVIIVLFLLSFAFGKRRKRLEAILREHIRRKKVRYYKKKEEEERNMAETHYRLLKYLKNKAEIEKHKNLMVHHEKEADKYHKKWVSYEKNKIICPVCGRAVPKGYEFCPYCGARLDNSEDNK